MKRGLWQTTAVSLVGVVSALVFAASALAATEPVTNLRVTGVGPATISLAWDAPASFHTFVATWVLGPAPGGGTLGDYPTSRNADTSALLGGLVCGSSYTVGVAWWDTGEQPAEPSATLQTATAACVRPPPAAPTGVRATPSDTDIVFNWDDQPFAVSALAGLTGPGVAASGGGYRTMRFDPGRVVCGETYTFTVYWIDDEGLRSPDTTINATALDCPPPVDDGPSGLRVLSSSWTTLTYGWDAYGASGLWLVRTTRTAGPPYTYLAKTTLSRAFRNLACGTPYPFTVQWVFTDGTVSTPSTLSASTAPCALATVTTGDPTSIGVTQATLGGTVSTNGSDTVSHFEYGTTPDYGLSSTTRSTSDHGTETRGVSSAVVELTPGTTYHYRLIASNAAGTAYGADRTFTTATGPAVAKPAPLPATPMPVARPRASCTVPRVKGLRLSAAKVRLARAHCPLGKVRRRHGSRSRRGKVLASTPAAGARTTGKVALVVGR